MVLRVLRLARIVRIAKLSRHSRNLNTLIKTMSTSLRELSFLMLFFIVSMVLYATFAYYCEQNAEATGVSIHVLSFSNRKSPISTVNGSETRHFLSKSAFWEAKMANLKSLYLVYINSGIILVGNRDHDNSRLW